MHIQLMDQHMIGCPESYGYFVFRPAGGNKEDPQCL